MSVVRGLQRLVVGREHRLARAAQHEAARRLSPREREERLRFVSEMRGEPGPDHVTLGRWPLDGGTPDWVGLSAAKLFRQHAWITGATGSGKSFFVLGILLQILRRGQETVVIVDLKGELSQLLRDVAIPALAGTPGGEGLVDRLRVIRPFDRRFLPALRVTAPEEDVCREVQAHAIASSLEDALGEPLGARMNRIFLKLTSLAIELDRPLPEVLRWLETPAALARDAQQSSDPRIRSYAAQSFGRENKYTLEALLARLDMFFFLPETRLSLSAPGCVSFQDCLTSGITIIDVGDPPAGAERVARFWAGILGGRLTRAILSRKVTDRSRQAWVIWEEFQEALGSSQTEQFSRLLALARYKKVSLWFVNQQPAQVAAKEPALVRALRTNTGLEVAFRCNLEDAKALAHALPLPEAGSAAGARQGLLEELTRLPDRTYLLWLKQAAFRAQKVRSPRLDLPGLLEAANQCPDELQDRIQRGTVAVPRTELEARVAEDEPQATENTLHIQDLARTPVVHEDEESNDVPFLG